jgi:ubiquinone/menaquinone biosynthesis C-methylase UbiE
MEQLVRFFYDKKIKTVIDAGTGSGEFISILKAVFPEAAFTGIDPSTEAIEMAKTIHPDVEFRLAGLENHGFASESFDLASISMALHHLPKLQKGLKELKRMVKPEGWFIICELYSDNLNPAQEVQKLFHHFRSATDRLLGISHRETFKRSEIIQIISEAGISPQFIFDWKKEPAEPFGNPEIEVRVTQMEKMLEQIKQFPAETEKLKPLISLFRENALQHGWQQATNVVVVGRKK